MWDPVINQVKPLLGDRAEEFVAALVASIKVREGGVEGFLKRIRFAGFASNLERWTAGTDTAPLSPSATAKLFGAAYLDKLAERNGVGIEDATDAASLALPGITRQLAPISYESVPVDDENALTSTDRNYWWAGLISVALLAGVVVLSLSCNRNTLQVPSAAGAPANVSPMKELHSGGAPGVEWSDATFSLQPTATGMEFSGFVDPSKIPTIMELLKDSLGEDRIKGALIGGQTRPAEWLDRLPAIIAICSDPVNRVSFNAVGKKVIVSGVAIKPTELQASVTEALAGAEVELDFSELRSPEVVEPIKP